MIIFKGNFENTGKYLGVDTYNHFLIKMKGDYYTPIWSTEKLRKILRTKVKGEKKGFFKSILKGLQNLKVSTDNIFVVEGDVFDFMRDLITLIIFGFSEGEIKQILKKPYTDINYYLLKSLLELNTGFSRAGVMLRHVNKKMEHEERTFLFNLLTEFYNVYYFPNEDPKYKYIIFNLNRHKNELIDTSQHISQRPYCKLYLRWKLYSLIHFCYIKPNKYSLHIFKNGEWIKLFDRINCKQMSKNILFELINYNKILEIDNNMMLVEFEHMKEYITEKNGECTISMFYVLKSIDKLYYVKKVGDNVEVFCAKIKPVTYKFQSYFKKTNFNMIEQDSIPYKILF